MLFNHQSNDHKSRKSQKTTSPDSGGWGVGEWGVRVLHKIDTDYGRPHQVNFNQDYWLMG